MSMCAFSRTIFRHTQKVNESELRANKPKKQIYNFCCLRSPFYFIFFFFHLVCFCFAIDTLAYLTLPFAVSTINVNAGFVRVERNKKNSMKIVSFSFFCIFSKHAILFRVWQYDMVWHRQRTHYYMAILWNQNTFFIVQFFLLVFCSFYIIFANDCAALLLIIFQISFYFLVLWYVPFSITVFLLYPSLFWKRKTLNFYSNEKKY